MSSAAGVFVEEYLSTAYRPDCDYIDGEVRERNLGEYPHSNLQGRLVIWLGTGSAIGAFAYSPSSASA
jgi:hypothetical protein